MEGGCRNFVSSEEEIVIVMMLREVKGGGKGFESYCLLCQVFRR